MHPITGSREKRSASPSTSSPQEGIIPSFLQTRQTQIAAPPSAFLLALSPALLPSSGCTERP